MIDLPLARPFLRWMCGGTLVPSDVLLLLPEMGSFLAQLQDLATPRQAIIGDTQLTAEEQRTACARLTLTGPAPGSQFTLDELDLTFVYLPTARVYGFHEHELTSVPCVERARGLCGVWSEQ